MQEKPITDEPKPWGTFRPPPQSRYLRFLIASGLSRGSLRKFVVRSWKERFGPVADVKQRGINFRLHLEDNATERKLLSGSKNYDAAEIRHLAKTCRGGIFVDIGANCGYYSLSLARLGAHRVLAIEPNPVILERLRFNLRINPFGKKATVIPQAIGDDGEAILFFAPTALGSASLRHDSPKKTANVGIRSRPLLDILKIYKIDRVDGLKIDVEGAEDVALLPFLRDAPEALLPRRVVIEHCNANGWKTDVIESFLGSGYSVTGRTKGNTLLTKSTSARPEGDRTTCRRA